MSQAYEISHLLAGVMLVTSFALLYQERVAAVLNAFAAQSITLALAVAWAAWSDNRPDLFITALIALTLKGIVIPVALHRTVARLGARMSAVDIAPTFVAHAQAQEQREPLGIAYEVANAGALPFAPAEFDFVTDIAVEMPMQVICDLVGVPAEDRPQMLRWSNTIATPLDADLSPSPALGDRILLERLAVNLIDNAVRYNVTGGSVRVVTGTGDGISYISVTNTGPLVPESAVESLFEPFMRLDGRAGNGRGVGLGLSIVASVVNAHYGHLQAEALPSGGMTISVRLPER